MVGDTILLLTVRGKGCGCVVGGGFHWVAEFGHTGAMTTKERLHELVDQLDDATAERLLSTAETLTPAAPPERAASDRVPSFVGAFASGRSDTAARAEQILRDELGAA